MEYSLQLEKRLVEYQASSKQAYQIKGWYFGINRNVAIKAGMKNSQIGGVYGCPKAEEGTRGKLYIIWQDNRRSVASLDSTTIENFQRLIEIWRRSSFLDEAAPSIYKGDTYPNVKLFDREVHDLVYEDQTKLFDLLKQYKNVLTEQGIKNVDASVSASSFHQSIKNSEGLNIENLSTSFSTYVYGDEFYGKSYIKRRLINEIELQNLIEGTISTVHKLKNQKPIQGGTMEVLLLPEVAERFIGHYLINNLNGSQVFNRRSPFTSGDFNHHTTMIREDMNLGVNTVTDYCHGAYISSFEGVPGGKQQLIQKGRLLSPILDLKYAGLMELQPTPIPAGKGSIYFYTEEMDCIDQMVGKIKNGIIVFDVLGMHTQDAASGNYSLTAPNCIRVEDGIMKESCKTVITGNFFEALRDPSTVLGEMPFEDSPCLLIKSKVTGEK